MIMFYDWCIQNDKTFLLDEWSKDRNGIITPKNISIGSGKKIWWKDIHGHEWRATISSRRLGKGCPFCSGRKVLIGFNDLLTVNPNDIVKSWDFEKNGDLAPTDVTAGSVKAVWWKCEKGHSWKAKISDRVQHKTACPVCAGKITLRGFNDLSTTNPDISAMWDAEKNYPLTPEEVTAGCNKEVWWKGRCGHEWKDKINNRVHCGTSCPICSGHRVLENYNDLSTTYPEIAREWDYQKNYPLLPSQVTKGYIKKVWWICPNGHSYSASVNSRTNRGSGCPICENVSVVAGINDLATTDPALAQEWNYEKNGSLLPSMITAGSSKVVWWKCEMGHQYQTSVYNRKRTNCPICEKERHISLPEKIIFYYIHKWLVESVENYRTEWLGKRELDIYIPSYKVGIEYDGSAWHDREKDLIKDKLCFNQGVKLLRIREPGCTDLNSTSVLFNIPKDVQTDIGIKKAIEFIFEYVKTNYHCFIPVPSVDISRDLSEIVRGVSLSRKRNSLAEDNPALVEEWDWEQNLSLTPDKVSKGSTRVVWWKCKKCGHSWQSSIYARNYSKKICPFCKELQKENYTLLKKYPDLAKDFDVEKNVGFDLNSLPYYYPAKIYWRCHLCGATWESIIKTRIKNPKCPFCGGKS